MKRIVPLLLLISLTTSACFVRGNGSKVAYGIDAAAVIGGAALIVDGKATQDRCDHRDDDDDSHGGGFPDLCGLDGALSQAAGTVLVSAGLLGILFNALVNRDASPDQKKKRGAPPMKLTAVQQGPPPVPELSTPTTQAGAWARW